jgi:hypothetical protein
MRQQDKPFVRYTRKCMWCGGSAYVLAPRGSDDLDIEAEFSAAGRAFGDDNETVGVGCYRCSRERWAVREQQVTR